MRPPFPFGRLVVSGARAFAFELLRLIASLKSRIPGGASDRIGVAAIETGRRLDCGDKVVLAGNFWMKGLR